MKRKIHGMAGGTAFLIIFAFFSSTIIAEIFGSVQAIADVKSLIVRGLFLLVPAIATVGITGFFLSRTRSGQLVDAKRKRMAFIGGNGIFILVPSAIYLNHLAQNADFATVFYAVQALELAAGGTNLILMSLNMRDGLRLTGRLKK